MATETKPNQVKVGEKPPTTIKMSELNEYIFFSLIELELNKRAEDAEFHDYCMRLYGDERY